MRAAVVAAAGGPDAISIDDIATPAPAAGQVRIKVAYAALNPLDTHARALRVQWMHPGFPFTLGFEFAGVVDACGDGVDATLIGNRVACSAQWGGCADYALAADSSLVPVPDGMDWKTAATFSTCAYTAWLLVHSAAKLGSGQSIAIHSAAGAVGAMLIQVAKSVGATVFALAGGDKKLAYAATFGADHLIDYTRDEWPEEVVEKNGGKGVDVIIDGNAGTNSMKNFAAIGPLGNIIYTGATAGEAQPISPSLVIGKSCSVTGFVQYVHQAVSGGAEKAATHDALISGKWRIPIERIYPLEDVAEAHRAFEARELVGRTLIEVGGDAVDGD